MCCVLCVDAAATATAVLASAADVVLAAQKAPLFTCTSYRYRNKQYG